MPMSVRAEILGLAPIHRLIQTFNESLEALGVQAPQHEIEHWSVLVDEAMAGRARSFHSHDHIFEFTLEGDPIQSLAGLFHDVVYVQVDQGLPERIAPILQPYLTGEPGAHVLGAVAEEDVPGQLVYQLFGVEAGARLSPFNGLNEVLSTLVAAHELSRQLSLSQVAEVVCCIEATIPFRSLDAPGGPPFERLAERLRRANTRFALGLDEAGIRKAICRAVRVGLRDVEGFASEDPARFLDNTWKLLPETNPMLRMPDVYSIRDYRLALQKMEGFLGSLPAERVFPRFQDEPSTAEYQRLVQLAARNLDVAGRYLRAKLYSMALLEALAVETGGDAPMELFTGGLPLPNGAPMRRLEHHLPPAKDLAQDQEPTVRELLVSGRASDTSFDLRASPTTALLYRHLGEAAIEAGMAQARLFFQGKLSARNFLRSQPSVATAPLARATACLAVTRTEALEALANEFEAPRS